MKPSSPPISGSCHTPDHTHTDIQERDMEAGEMEADTAGCIITGRESGREKKKERLCSTASSHHHRYAAADDAFLPLPHPNVLLSPASS